MLLDVKHASRDSNYVHVCVTPLSSCSAVGFWAATLSIGLQKAAAVDPDNQASVPGEAGQAARQARLDACYAPVAAVVRFLVRMQMPERKCNAGVCEMITEQIM